MATKKFDLCVKVGSYTVEDKVKHRYLNIGAMFESDKGLYILLNKTFNPAGIPSEGTSIIVSLFAPKTDKEPAKEVTDPSEIEWKN